jgi:hypothetical protein
MPGPAMALDDPSMAGVTSDDRLILRHCRMPLERQLETERCRHEVSAYLKNEGTLIRAMGLSFGIFRVGRGKALSLCNFRLELLALKLSIVRLIFRLEMSLDNFRLITFVWVLSLRLCADIVC